MADVSLENEPSADVFVPTKRLKGKSYRKAAEEPVDLTSDSEEPVKKYPGPSGLMMEVVIPVHGKSVSSTSLATTPATTPAPSSSGAESNMSDEESDVPRAMNRRATAKKPIIISDDESSDEDAQPAKSRKAAPAKKSHKRSKESSGSSSDYEDGEDDYEDESESAEGTASDSDSVQASDSEEEPKSRMKAKKKAPAKKPAPKHGKKQSLPSSEASEEDMAVDDPPPKAKASGKKRKAEGDEKEKPVKKQKRREETDPWKLESAGVKRDWTQMQAPPLEMFHFSRIVVDEYTYLDGKTHSMVTRQSGDRKWVLSGTVSYSSSHFILKVCADHKQISHPYMISAR